MSRPDVTNAEQEAHFPAIADEGDTPSGTPTPWKIFRAKNGVYLGIGQESGEGIVDCGFGLWRDGKERDANAELIVEAVNNYATLRADRDRLREVAAELDRLCLVITSSVRFADPKNLPLIHKLVRDNREALQSSTGAA